MSRSPDHDILILWNEDYYSDLLRSEYPGLNIITSSSELRATETHFGNSEGAIVLVELSWDDLRFSHHHGIEIVRTILRARHKLRFPILFVSFLPIEQLFIVNGNKRLENQIVGAVGHGFHRLPASPTELFTRVQELTALNELQFADVLNNICNLGGLVGGRIHELQGRLRSLNNYQNELPKVVRAMDEFFDEVSTLLEDRTGVRECIRQFRQDFQVKISEQKTSPQDVYGSLERFGAKVSALIMEGADIVEREASAVAKVKRQAWKVLLLDDEPGGLRSLSAALGSNGIECFLAETVDQAERIIKDDVFNEITVAIADYRLLECLDGVEKHQQKQGYDFLFWLASQNHLTHLVALSGLSRKFLLESFQKYNTRVDVYSKQDLIGGHAVSLFVDSILDRGNEVYEAVCSRPTVGDWKSLRPFYVVHRASTQYRSKEQEINARASRYIRQYEEILEHRDAAVLLQPGLDRISELTTKLADKNPSESRSMDAFYSKLVGRRISLWLNLKLGFSRNEVFAALKGYLNPSTILLEIEDELKNASVTYDETIEEELKTKVHKKYKDNATNLVTTNLALSFPVSGNELLVEERFWLTKEIGIRNLDSPFSLSRQIPYFVQIGLEQFLEAAPKAAARLKKESENFTRSGKPVLISIEAAREMIKDAHGVTSSEADKANFKNFLRVLDQNIRRKVSDDLLTQEFLSLISELSN